MGIGKPSLDLRTTDNIPLHLNYAPKASYCAKSARPWIEPIKRLAPSRTQQKSIQPRENLVN